MSIPKLSKILIETKRLRLRPLSLEDQREFVCFHQDALVMAPLMHGVLSSETAEALLSNYVCEWEEHGYGMFRVEHRESGKYIGLAGLWQRSDGQGVALRFAIASDAQGRGYAKEAGKAVLSFAFESAHLDRVIAVTRDDNDSSKKVLEHLGMRNDGTFENDDRVLVRYIVQLQKTQDT